MGTTLDIILVSGLSGAGKSVVLNALEDLGRFCIDNLPASMLETLVSHALRDGANFGGKIGIGIDARDVSIGLTNIPEVIGNLRRSGLRCQLLVVTASDAELLRRFGETKRRHPLSRIEDTLQSAISREREVLDPVIQIADLVIDTTHLGVHQLRDMVVQRVDQRQSGRLSMTLVSFGFKYGIPGDCDFVMDARTLPNPYWVGELRDLTGLDRPVMDYLDAEASVERLLGEFEAFILARIEDHKRASRRYLTVGIGCTGGQHRSVYLVERLRLRLAGKVAGLTHRHSSLTARS
jgi:RNase adapter protein RapZ